MTETDVDLRAYTLVLVAHSLLNGRGRVRASARLVDWAHGEGYGIYQLPEPAHLFDPALAQSDDPDGDADGDADDRAQLDFVFSQLRVYVGNGYRVAGVILEEGELEGPAGRAWLRQLREVAEQYAIALDPVRVIAADAGDTADFGDPGLVVEPPLTGPARRGAV